MKKHLTAALFLALCLCLTAARASGADAGETLISRSYLEETFSQTLSSAITARLDAAGQTFQNSLSQRLDALPSGTDAGIPGEQAASAGDTATLKEGDTLTGSTGMVFTPLGGDVQLSASGGPVIDVTEGREAASGLLKSGRRYIVAENAAAVFTVASPAAVVSWRGGGTLERSSQPDYYAIAIALRSLDLFRGSGSGIGDGFDLYRAPTRGEGLVMFLRLLGEEAAALACADSHPFTDVPAWLDPYVAWACRQGYSNGVSAASFAPDQPFSAVEYVELMLRALHYSTAGEDDYTASLERGLRCGVLTDGEYAVLRESPFRRAHVAYLSYYSLDTAIGGARQTLAQRMISEGLLTEEQLTSARTQVETLRLT